MGDTPDHGYFGGFRRKETTRPAEARAGRAGEHLPRRQRQHVSEDDPRSALYELIAFAAIRDGEEVASEFRWLVDPDRQVGPGKVYRRSVLVELGRVEDPDELRIVARRICKLKPKARDAVAMIRRYRVGEPPRVRQGALADELIRIVNAYVAAHPAASWSTVRTEVEQVLAAVDWMIERRP